jgi:Tfp pilus assembly PilM family ATPase
MAQFLALEWDGSEARLAVASSRGETGVIEQAFSVSLRSRQPGEEQTDVDVGSRIAAALAARGIGRIDTLVAVGRANIELRQLSLPPAPDEELPEMVRFQAMREFNELDEDWLLDFVPIDEGGEGPRNVLAAAIAPDLVAQIQKTCETAGLAPRRLVLRPCAAASLLGRSQSAGPATLRLLVDLLADEADLTVMIDRRVVFLRTTRVGGDPLASPEHGQALLGEIRRTMAAAQNQLGGRRVESIVLCGRGEQHAALAATVAKELATPTEWFDPFEGLTLGRELKRGLPDHPGRFAPLLGMLLAELEGTGHAIDFLHPRRPPPPPSRRNKYVLAGVAVALLVLSVPAYLYYVRTSLAGEISRLEGEKKLLDAAIAKGNKTKTTLAEIDKWRGGDIVWLDELRHLCEDFPSAEEAMLTELTLRPRTRGGEMLMEGLARDSTSIDLMEKDLREGSRRLVGKDTGEAPSPGHYKWRFSSSVLITPGEK